MIDENKLIEDIEEEIKCMNEEKERYFKDGNFHNGNIIVEQISAIKIIKKIINNQPKIGEWIPCSERLPEEDGSYLVTRPYYGMFITDNMHFNKGSFTDKYVCAWKPLPAPYEVKSDE